MSREITTHHDGFGLNERIKIVADEPGPGGASHKYNLSIDIGGAVVELGTIQFQKGPRTGERSTPGILDGVLLAIVLDRMNSFNAGEYRCRENAVVATHIEEAMNMLWRRAKTREQRGVLGTNEK